MIVGATPAATIVIEKVWGPDVPALFVAVMITLEVAAAVGVPLSTPVEDMLSPAGRLVPLQLIGVVPVAVNCRE